MSLCHTCMSAQWNDDCEFVSCYRTNWKEMCEDGEGCRFYEEV